MQNYCKTIGALAAASALVAGNAQAGTAPMTTAPAAPAAETGIEYELHAGYTNEYLFRGKSFGTDLIEAGADISGEAFGLGLSAGVWYANYQAPARDFSNFAGQSGLDSNVNEIDLYAEVSKDFGFMTAAVGYIYYYNDTDSATDFANASLFGGSGKLEDYQEVYFSLSRDFGFATASLTYFWDIVGDNDGYSEFALSRSFELTSCLALNVGSNVGYLVEEGVATAWTTKVGIDWAFAEHAKLSPFVAYSVSLSDDINTAYYGNQNEFVAGSMISVSF